jgi:nicotinamide-nucleotide amidase
MFGAEIEAAVVQLADLLRARGQRLVSAESCTGGLVAAACTSIAGSSDWFERGFVTYSNEAKVEMLGVDPALIARHGAVSEEVVRAMAQGALARSRATWSIAVSGVAGPGGGGVGVDGVGGARRCARAVANLAGRSKHRADRVGAACAAASARDRDRDA